VKHKDVKSRLREIEKADKAGHTVYVMELSKNFVADFPDSILGWYYFGTSLYAVARYKEGLVALQRLRRLLAPSKQQLVQSEFGHLYRKKGELRRAASWYRKAISSDPIDAKYYIYLGAVLATAGRLSEAETMHRKATQCREGCIDEAYLNLDLVLRAQGRYPEARRCFQRALKISPGYKEAKNELEDMKHVLSMRSATP
jgi:tetratricopeptide (TPR) repeat protein